jgi:exosortase
MTSVRAPAELPRPGAPSLQAFTAYLPLIVAGLALAIPTFLRLGEQVWSKEFGAHGPIVLFTGGWLLWRRWGDMQAMAKPGPLWLTLTGAVMAAAFYIFGRAYDFMILEALGLYGFFLVVLHDRLGLKAMFANWFPLVYLGLLLPPPGWLLDQVTAPLKLLVSVLATGVVEPLGIPIAREGVTMTVGPYQLLVEDACSGLNSLIGLIAVTLFYIYLLRGSNWRYSAFLVCLIIPVAIIANAIRIVILINLTYFFGDAVGQGFLHKTAGLFLFATALALVFAIDSGLSSLLKKRSVAAA